MMWLRRVAAAPLLLLTLICGIGTVRIFGKDLPGSSVGDRLFAAFVAAASGAGAYLLLRPDLRTLRGLSLSQIRKWVFGNPLGQATLLYAAAAVIMLAGPKHSLLPALLAQCFFSVLSAWTAAFARRWWTYAALAVLGFVLLLCALAATAEALTPRGFGEAGMVFLLPMEGFPILLAVSGIVRLTRGSMTKS